ncbi:unnamed protein product [Phaedon cochleariae]|uniref:Uncharacterized protein n=1 Tax=Phaedon cochleariae TaxID=80249 RepID=A0A9N9SDV8_PHACE|nr:unnamed protein product [Phaedon cochleariae]
MCELEIVNIRISRCSLTSLIENVVSFGETGALSLTVVGLSSSDKEVRQAACHVLFRFHNHVEARQSGKDNILWIRYVEAVCKAIFVDLKKAFNAVDHITLLDNLESMGLKDMIRNLSDSYLQNRTIRTKSTNSESHRLPMTEGVRPGSVLYYLLNIQNITKFETESNYTIYDDDGLLIVRNMFRH